VRFLRPTSERQYDVFDDSLREGQRVGIVWRAGTDAPDSKRWRASAPSGSVEWRPWRFYDTPQMAAKACVAEYARTTSMSRSSQSGRR
jgi:hypothetical protein